MKPLNKNKMNKEELLKEMMKKDEVSGIYKQLTAVEWLVDQYVNLGTLSKSICEQAKKMERDAIIEAHKQSSIESGFEDSAEDWANEYWERNY